MRKTSTLAPNAASKLDIETSGNRLGGVLVLAERAMSSARSTIETIFAFDETVRPTVRLVMS